MLVKNINDNKYYYQDGDWYYPCDDISSSSYRKSHIENNSEFIQINVSELVEEGEDIYYINVDTSLSKEYFSIKKHHKQFLSGNIFVSEKKALKHHKYFLDTLLEKSIPVEKIVLHDIFISDDISYIKEVLKKHLI
jgi:hypothetical protein